MALVHFLDHILPGDDELSMPSATQLHIDKQLKHNFSDTQIIELYELLDETAQQKFQADAFQLNHDDFLLCLERSKRKNIKLIHFVVTECLTAYYTHPTVLSKINAGTIPPFPEGNYITEPDWLMLEPVFERGTIYRNVP